MPNNYFSFKQFTIHQKTAAFKVGTDGVLLGACADLSGASRILDIGTGTGLIAIMIAQRCGAEIVAIEPAESSFPDARENVKNCEWNNRIDVRNIDLLSFCSEKNGQFDILISNPPYFRDSLKNPDAGKSWARHTDSLSSSDILNSAASLMKAEGSLQLILPYAEGTLFIAEASQFGLYCNRIVKIRPVPTGEIKRMILKFERNKKRLSEKFLTIETGSRHSYTEEYKALTKDFYLKF